MSAIPAPPADYWARHQTIVITWPGNMPGVAAIGRHRRNADGTLSVEYTREDLELATVAMREFERQRALPANPAPTPAPEPAPMPEPARLVFGRMSKADGHKLVRQAEQASQQEALL